jgi:DNA modification methylase
VTEPYINDRTIRLYQGGALPLLREMPDESVDMAVTSPPFWALRDYGTGRWEGGDPACDHRPRPKRDARELTRRPGLPGKALTSWTDRDATPMGNECTKCGAVSIDSQIGLEDTPDEWVASLVEVFREVRRLLRPHGCLLLECGDSYNSNAPGGMSGSTLSKGGVQPRSSRGVAKKPGSLKPKDLVGQPWSLAFALREDGWWLRGAYIWDRPNPMPESVTDRCTTSHTTVFHLTKSMHYFWDPDAIAEPVAGTAHSRGRGSSPKGEREARVEGRHVGWDASVTELLPTKNARSVWSIPTEPSGIGLCSVCHAFWPRNAPDQHCGADVIAHYAAFPVALAEKAIRAASSEFGYCPDCRSPWIRMVEKGAPELGANTWSAAGAGSYDLDAGGYTDKSLETNSTLKHVRAHETVGWEATCECGGLPVPGIVLDPFAGSGTTFVAARRLGRHAVGTELNPHYCEMTARRLEIPDAIERAAATAAEPTQLVIGSGEQS